MCYLNPLRLAPLSPSMKLALITALIFLMSFQLGLG
jgi:hypothetical protein